MIFTTSQLRMVEGGMSHEIVIIHTITVNI